MMYSRSIQRILILQLITEGVLKDADWQHKYRFTLTVHYLGQKEVKYGLQPV